MGSHQDWLKKLWKIILAIPSPDQPPYDLTWHIIVRGPKTKIKYSNLIMIFPIKLSFLFVAFIEQNVHCLQLIGMQILPENESAGKFLKKT